MRGHRKWLCLLAWALFSPAVHPQDLAVTAYNSYVMPPFLADESDRPTGLAAGLIKALNQELKGHARLTLENLPRHRLLKLHLDDPASFAGVVLFLAPQFVGDTERSRWHWTAPLFQERHMLVFLAGTTLRIRQQSDLQGLRFGGVLGNRYPALDDMVQHGQMSRTDSGSELILLRNVALGRIDFTQMSELIYAGLSSRPELAGRLRAIPQPGQAPFERRILVGRATPGLSALLDGAVMRLPCNAQWQTLAREYGAQLPVCSSLAHSANPAEPAR